MKLRYITCSDPREHNSIKSIIDLAHLPHAEIAVQCHPSAMDKGMPRNVWFNELLYAVRGVNHVNLAIHVNQKWANEICVNGKIPDIILNWIRAEKYYNHPIIKRIQLNMPRLAAENINADALAKVFHDFKNQEFIVQYNERTKSAIEKLNKTGAKFSILFDASGGNGILPEIWQKPVYENHPFGYSGGISPENVSQNLDKIQNVTGKDYETWIDAEGRLKSLTLFDEKPLFDVENARAYVQNANRWMRQK